MERNPYCPRNPFSASPRASCHAAAGPSLCFGPQAWCLSAWPPLAAGMIFPHCICMICLVTALYICCLFSDASYGDHSPNNIHVASGSSWVCGIMCRVSVRLPAMEASQWCQFLARAFMRLHPTFTGWTRQGDMGSCQSSLLCCQYSLCSSTRLKGARSGIASKVNKIVVDNTLQMLERAENGWVMELQSRRKSLKDTEMIKTENIGYWQQ